MGKRVCKPTQNAIMNKEASHVKDNSNQGTKLGMLEGKSID